MTQDLLSMGSWKVTCAEALAAAVELRTGREEPPPPPLLRCSADPLPSGGKLLLSDTELPYTGSLSADCRATVPVVCWGRGPPSTGDRSVRPAPPRGADGDGFCWLEAERVETAMVPSAGRLLRAAVPACDRATES